METDTQSAQSLASVAGRGTAWMAATTFVMKGVGFVYIFLVLNYLTVFEYGVAELITSAVPLLSLFLLPGLHTTVIADMARERGVGNISRMKGLLISYFKLQYLFAVIAWALVFFGAHLLAVWYGQGSTVQYFQIVSFLFLLSPLRAAMQTVQSVNLAFRQQSLYTFLEESWKLILLAVFLLVLHMRIDGLLLAFVLCQVLALASIALPLWALDRSFWSTKGERFPIFHFLMHHGKWGVASNYLGTFGKNIRPWIINFFLGPQAVGIYAVAQGLIGHVVSLMPLDSVMRPILPQYVQMKERFYALIAKSIKYELLGFTVVSIASAVGVPILVAFFFPQYAEAVPLFQITLIMLVSTAFDSIFTGVFFALQAQRSLFWASVYKLVLLVILMPPFIYFFGLYGAAYANILSNSLYVFERYLKLKRLMPGFSLKIREFVTMDDLDRMILARIWQFSQRLPVLGLLLKHPADAATK